MTSHVARTPILVVDDDPGIRLLLGIAGSAVGYDVVTARSAEDAIRALRGPAQFAAVISDFWMPGLTGLELLRWTKRHVPSCAVLLTSSGFPAGVEDEARAAGADAVVPKRVLVEHFASVIDEALQPLAA